MYGLRTRTNPTDRLPIPRPLTRVLAVIILAGAPLMPDHGWTAETGEARSNAGLVSVNLSASNMTAVNAGLSSRSSSRPSSRPAIDARGLSHSRRGLSSTRRSDFHSRSDRVRFRSRGIRYYALEYPDRRRSGGETRITIRSSRPATRYIVPGDHARRRTLRDGLCRESGTRLCITPRADFYSVELLCDADSHKFGTAKVAHARFLRCPSGMISSVWVERPGRTLNEGEGLSIRFDPGNCPVPSPCGTAGEPADHSRSD